MEPDEPKVTPQGGPELIQAEKMRALGTFAAHIAHDFNNVLTGILGQIGLMGEALAEGDLAQASVDLRNVEASAVRGAELVRKLLGFSRRQAIQRVPLSVTDLLEDVGPFLRVLLPQRIAISTRSHGDGWILADPVLVEHMIMNLATNARDAMPDGGTLRIEAFHRTLSREECAAWGWGAPGRYVAIRAEDSGTGIPPEILDRVLDPFFTTRAEQGGTGLGLAMVYGLMKQHEGWVHLEPAPGGGTRAELLFPTLDEPTAVAPVEHPQHVRRGSECIVVAEDDEVVREALARILKRNGYTVRTAADGLEALAVLQHWPEVDLLIADIAMPRLGGVSLGEILKEQGHRVPVLFTSGLDSEHARHAQGLSPTADFLPKPWTVGELLAHVRALLDRGSPPHG